MQVKKLAYAVWFSECDKRSVPEVGGKNANIGEMIRSGFRVPPGFAVTVDAYDEALRQAGIIHEIYQILSQVHPEDATSINKASESIQQLIRAIAIPEEVGRAIDDYYQALAGECNVVDLPVAVRSSATAEDLPRASFAGQQDTYLWIRGRGELKKYIIECWASLFTARAIAYRSRMGFPHEKVLISVGVQKMVEARVAGLLFTLNPINGDPSKILISASWGFGPPVVSGEVTPDEWMVDKVTLEIIKRTISPKAIEHRLDPAADKLVVVDIAPERQDIPSLSDEEIIELAKVATAIEEHYGVAQDTEWAIAKDVPFPENVIILQTRPETVWSQREAKPIVQPGASALSYIMDTLRTGKRF